MTRTQSWIGFLATGLLLISLAMVILREPTLQSRAATTQLQTSIVEGVDIYLENCVVCHGASGEGLGVYPALNAVAEMDPVELYRVIERGRFATQMAAYGIDEGGILSQMQIESLVSMIQHVDWDGVYAIADERDLIPLELVAAEIPDEILMVVSELADGDRLSDGLTLYAENCTSCHGVNMEGTTLAPALDSDTLREKETYEIARIIEQGVPGTLMAGWDNALDDRQVDDLVALILRWPEVQSAGIEIPVVEAEPLDMSPEAITRGERLFDITCTSCHGVDGYGSPLAPALNNSLFLDETSDAAMRQIIAMGVSGTVMPAWGGRFSDTQIHDIIAYLRSLQPTSPTVTQSR